MTQSAAEQSEGDFRLLGRTDRPEKFDQPGLPPLDSGAEEFVHKLRGNGTDVPPVDVGKGEGIGMMIFSKISDIRFGKWIVKISYNIYISFIHVPRHR